MNQSMRIAYEEYVSKSKHSLKHRDYDMALYYLEFAHILGQKSTFLHVRSHILMLIAGFHKKDYKEVLGQVTRILASMIFSKIWVPVGNTGRSHVNAFESMPVPTEIKELMEKK